MLKKTQQDDCSIPFIAVLYQEAEHITKEEEQWFIIVVWFVFVFVF